MHYWTKFKNYKLLVSTIIYSGFSILTAAIPFMLTPYLARNLSPELFGQIAMFGIWTSALGIIIGLGSESTIGVIYFDKKNIVTKVYISSCIFIMVLVGFILAVQILIFSNEIITITLLPKNWLFLGLVISVMQFIISIRLILWQIKKESLYYGLMNFIINRKRMKEIHQIKDDMKRMESKLDKILKKK